MNRVRNLAFAAALLMGAALPLEGARAAPFVIGYALEVTGATFFSVTLPLIGVDPYDILVAGIEIGEVLPGATFNFGPAVTAFDVIGISPPLDAADPDVLSGLAFPVGFSLADFSGPSIEISQTPILAAQIPEPATFVLFAAGIAGLAFARQRRRV
jgi:hypothetical protein